MLFLTFLKASAHPLDISSTSWSFKDNQLRLTTFFHTYEIEYFLNKNNKFFKWTYDYFQYSKEFWEYVKNNIYLNLEGNKCEFRDFEMTQKQEYEILTYWVETNYKIICEKPIISGDLKITFFSNFPLQTNQLSLYDLNDVNQRNSFANIILTNDFNTFKFDLNDKISLCKIDTDWDWINDDLEQMYKTDPYKIDTDGDFYTDFEEINSSYSPLDKNLWPGQNFREEIPKDILSKTKNNVITKQMCDEFLKTNKDIKTSNWLLSSWFWNEYFAKTLKQISNYLYKKSDESIFYILLVIVGLWFIHAAWPGHSKSLLVSYIVDKNKSFFDWLMFVTIFSITHLLDIILLFVVTKVIFWIYDISNYMLYIQRISLIILMFFSVYLIFKSIKNYWKNIQKCEKSDKKSSIFLWFVSWLAPCTFWWSIFLLLFWIWNMSLIIPMLLALWFWIFLFLFLVLVIVYFLRVKFLQKIDIFSKISSLISSIILLILSIFLMINLY